MKESTHRNKPSAVNVPPDKVKLNPIQAKPIFASTSTEERAF